MKYEIIRTTAFKKEYKLACKRGLNMRLLHDVIEQLANDEILPEKYRDHRLIGDQAEFRECHIQPDWLLVYRKNESSLILTLVHTGSHSDLFDM